MKIATIGTGFIVDTFLSAVDKIDGIECIAMYSRRSDNAKRLANKYKVEKIYTSLEALYKDSSIDIIYVASPNSLHFEHSYEALKHGKNVICEKPFTSTLRETEQLVALAKEKNLFLFEGITTIHLPNYKLLKNRLDQIGKIRFIQCNYSQYSSRYTKLLDGEITNVFNPKYSGGALADINIYNLHFVINSFGHPETVQYTANLHENGIDTSGVVVLKYPDFIAECVGSKDTNGMNFVLIQGEEGYIHIEHGANGCQKVILHTGEQEVSFNSQTVDNLLYYELLSFKQVTDNRDFDQCYQWLEHTSLVMDVFEQARKDAGIVFEADKRMN